MKRNSGVRKILLSLVFVFALHLPCHAQAPTLQETLDWLTKKINLYSYIETRTDVERVDCTYEATSSLTTFVLVERCERGSLPSYTGPSTQIKETRKFTILLMELDPHYVEVIKSGTIEARTITFRIGLNTHDKKKVIALERRYTQRIGREVSPESVTNSQENFVSIHFTRSSLINTRASISAWHEAKS